MRTRSSELPGELWTISCKLYGIGELIKFHNGESSLNQQEANLGIGGILTDLASELDQIRNELESRNYKPTREKPKDWDGGDQESS